MVLSLQNSMLQLRRLWEYEEEITELASQAQFQQLQRTIWPGSPNASINKAINFEKL